MRYEQTPQRVYFTYFNNTSEYLFIIHLHCTLHFPINVALHIMFWCIQQHSPVALNCRRRHHFLHGNVNMKIHYLMVRPRERFVWEKSCALSLFAFVSKNVFIDFRHPSCLSAQVKVEKANIEWAGLLTLWEVGAEAAVGTAAVGAEADVDDVTRGADGGWTHRATDLRQQRELCTRAVMHLRHRGSTWRRKGWKKERKN